MPIISKEPDLNFWSFVAFITVVNLVQGEYIAVRTEGQDFYLAEVLQDVLEKDNVESFKVQWFDISGEDNVYVRSYEDTVDARSVVCPEVKLKKESGGRFRLKKPMLDKIKKRIKRALSGNTLSSSGEDNDDDDEDRVDKAKPLKLPGAEMRTFRHRSKFFCSTKSSTFFLNAKKWQEKEQKVWTANPSRKYFHRLAKAIFGAVWRRLQKWPENGPRAEEKTKVECC